MAAKPLKIKIDTGVRSLAKGLPPYLFRNAQTTFTPLDFKPLSDRFTKERVYTAEQQLESIQTFIAEPAAPRVLCITGSVDDSQAKILAAHLVQKHIAHKKLDANPIWSPIYGGFDTIVDEYKDTFRQKPSMIVVSNLTPGSTNNRLERARDILDFFQDVPRIVVAAGEDPISFMAFRMRYEVHGIAYFSSAAIRQAKTEVI